MGTYRTCSSIFRARALPSCHRTVEDDGGFIVIVPRLLSAGLAGRRGARHRYFAYKPLCRNCAQLRRPAWEPVQRVVQFALNAGGRQAGALAFGVGALHAQHTRDVANYFRQNESIRPECGRELRVLGEYIQVVAVRRLLPCFTELRVLQQYHTIVFV